MVDKSSSSNSRNNDNIRRFPVVNGTGGDDDNIAAYDNNGFSESGTTKDFVWPKESAEQVIFQVPEEWKDSYCDDDDDDDHDNNEPFSYCCKIHYDSLNRFLV